ncbi:MAG: hypothetical protein KY447_00785 [Actinobacteria bacterium]|nr:hypothetical protein [Actinomycetota bacterium]MBW3641430.1 hypothetical protein [Actinomycetota bacterium]
MTAALVALVSVAACGGSDGDTDRTGPSTTTTTSASSTTSTAPAPGSDDAAPSSTTSSAPVGGFEGRTTATSAPAPPGSSEVALLSDVRVAGQPGFDRVVFEFGDAELPGFDISYLDGPAHQDGSGEPVTISGSALLEVRLAPASGVDLRAGTFEQTYTGPGRVEGDTEVVTEVVRTGDFEANLTWAIGLDRRVPYRVEVIADPPRVVIDLATG